MKGWGRFLIEVNDERMECIIMRCSKNGIRFIDKMYHVIYDEKGSIKNVDRV